MRRVVIVLGMVLGLSGTASAQGYCDHFTFPPQGTQADGSSGENERPSQCS